MKKIGKMIHASGLAARADELRNLDSPGKKDQDSLDAMICVITGYFWLACSDGGKLPNMDFHMAMIGDTESGYMVTPVIDSTERRLRDAAKKQGANYWPPDN